MRFTENEVFRYIVGGAANVLLTYSIYLLILSVMSYLIAYSVAYIAGIGIAYFLNSRYVFSRRPSVKTALQFPLVYPVQYALGIILLHTLVDVLGTSELYAPFAVVALTAPITFLLTRTIFKGAKVASR